MFTSFEMDEKQRVKIQRELVGRLTTLQPDDEPGAIPKWAPSWWHGDDDATASNMAAMKALQRR